MSGAQASFSAALVDEWARAGLTDAVVCPGSRSTPLVAALVLDGRLRLHSVLDERSAGFVALGIGLASGRPGVVVTTSGTAAVELHPAVVEASYAGVPLLVVTADRPPRLRGVGAPQTVDQAGIYGSAPRFSADPGVATEFEARWWRSLASRVVAETLAGPGGPGPVHLNLPFDEPLLSHPGPLPAGRRSGAPWHSVNVPELAAPTRAVARLAGLAGSHGVVVAGGGSGQPEAVLAMAEGLRWPLFADPTSGCRLPSEGVVAAADSLLRGGPAAWAPDVVVRMGRPWASRVLSAWLDGLDCPQVLVDPWGDWRDPERRAGEVVRADPTALARSVAVAAGQRDPTAWWRDWVGAERSAQDAIDDALAKEGGVTEPGLARHLVAGLPEGASLMVASSMPVRDVEWWSRPRRGVKVLSNRGTNGIDGVVSTAVGVALARPKPVFALVGDLAFLHDSNALLGAEQRGVDLTVVVVDNRGGGIFNFLPQAEELDSEVFERLWATPQPVDVGEVAAAFGAQVSLVGSLDDVQPGAGAGVRVLVARTDRQENVAVHGRLHAAVVAGVG